MAEEEKKKHKWIKGATKNAHDQFRAKAEATGESTAAYAREHEDDSGITGKQARLAKSLMSMHNAHHKHSTSNKKMRNSMYGSKD